MKKLLRTILRGIGLYAFAIDLENKLITLFKKSERKDFYGQFIKSGDLCFDVGANKGNRTVIFLELGAKVVAVEPQKECYEFLTKRFGDKIELVKYGLGEKESTETMYVSGSTLISSFSKDHVTMMQEDRFKGASWGKTIEIKMTTLDVLIEKYGTPAFCKIDVENYEVEVLKGLSHAIPALSVEYFPATIERAIECVELLEALGKYTYNWSFGESQKLNTKQWLTEEEIKKVLSAVKKEDSYGDFYARLLKNN